MAIPALRSEVLHLCDELQGILAFNYQLGTETRDLLGSIRQDVPAARARTLREYRVRLRAAVKSESRRFGLKRGKGWENMLKEFKQKSADPAGKPLLPKFVIDAMFTNYTDRWIDWASYPPHILVSIDFTADLYRPGEFDWRLPEASLYEDMCIAYNMALDKSKVARSATVPVRPGKLLEFCLRSAVLSAFYFVEAYLNGVAFDFVMRNGKKISDQDAEYLWEWDGKLKKERWVNFKDKLYRYPRIILGLQHPPFTESNCLELKLLLTRAKEVRDAIVHQSPKPDLSTGVPGTKLATFMHLRLSDTTDIVDASIAFVRKLNTALGKNGITMNWLVDRDSTGRFPEKAFI